MSEFKVGDEFYRIMLKKNKVVLSLWRINKIEGNCRYRDEIMVNQVIWDSHEDFKSKQECIDAFKKRLDEL